MNQDSKVKWTATVLRSLWRRNRGLLKFAIDLSQPLAIKIKIPLKNLLL